MHTPTLAYSTPPGFTPPALPPSLTGSHRAIDVGPAPAPRPRQSAPRPASRPEPPAEIAFGLSWRIYLAAVIVSAMVLVLIGTHLDGARRLDALVPAAVVFGVSLMGLADYARRGADR